VHGEPALVVILVEGVSDQVAVETLATRRGRDLSAERVAVVPIGGAGAVRRVLAEQGSPGVRLAALCDVGEEGQVRRMIEASGLDVAVHVCVADLEDELIRAVGVDQVLAVLDRAGDRRSFTTLQQQPAWRGRPPVEQLRRFFGAGARRKVRYARLLTDAAVDLGCVPLPLTQVLGDPGTIDLGTIDPADPAAVTSR
jgi:hypothetical protein